VTPAPGSIVANRFKLIRELGRGSMGAVWLADHLSLDVQCAVKLMAGAALRDPSSRARFALEAKAIAQLQSPHIVRVVDCDVHDDTPFIAMELLQGEDLSDRLRRMGRLDANATYRIVAQIAHGLAKAHAAGIIHRDLKPENIFLAQTDDGEIAKLLDFGIAKTSFSHADTGTLDGTVLGTPDYMSPEQVRGKGQIDHRSDLWSLAVVAYECLLGQLPFEGPGLCDVFAKILSDPIPVPSQHAPPGVCISAAFDRWWACAVSRDVESRFVSAQELTDALGKALGILGGRAWEGTPPAFAIPSMPPSRIIEPAPKRGRWRARLFVAAAALSISATAVAVNIRHDRGAPRGLDEPHVQASMAEAAPMIAPRNDVPQPTAKLDNAPSLETVSTAPASSATEHALCDPSAHAKSNAPPWWLSSPPPRAQSPARSSLGAARPVHAAKRPADDVDFGI
jgi:serine/threonine protein kinase